MAFYFGMQLFGALVFLTLLSQVIGHSYITSPASRSNQGQTLTGCRGPACLGPCDVPLARKVRASTTVARGSNIEIKWPRNNHAGGFIRFAWAPTSQSDSHAAFDAHVQQINCHEVGGCHPDDLSNPNGGDSGPADGSTRACASNFTVPSFLTDGDWTLQWAWFGGAFALGDYYSCVDYKISGGPSGVQTAGVFVGGDFTYPNQQKCKFFNTDKLHQCVNEPCTTGNYPNSAEQSGVPAAGQLGSANAAPSPAVTTGASAPVTTASVAPATTGAAVPVTTGSVRPMTTGMPAPVTTGSVAPITPVTTGAAPVVNTPVPTTPTTPVSTGSASNAAPCVFGKQMCIGSSQYQTCTNGRESTYWAPLQSCQAGLMCHNDADGVHIRCY